MRIAFVNQFFHPDVAATAQLVTDLAEDLAADGNRVTAIAGQGSYLGQERYPRRDFHKGIEILRVPVTRWGRSHLVGRIADYASYFAACSIALMALPRQDVVVTLSTPPLLGLAGSAKKAASRGRTKFVYWVQDLYPDLAVKFGVLEEHAATTRLFEGLSRISLASADAVVALGETMAQKLEAKGVSRERVRVVHNWSDGDKIGTVAPEHNWFLYRHGLEGKFIVLYSGNMGRGHELGTIVDVARELRDESRVVFVFIGEGAKREEIERAAARLPNVKLLPYQRREDLPYRLGAAGLMVVTLADGLEGLIVPSKLYGALAAQKPVLYVGPEGSEAAQIVRAHSCGQAFLPGDTKGVGQFIQSLAANREWAANMGTNGREAFDKLFERRIATAKFARVLHEVCATGKYREEEGEAC